MAANTFGGLNYTQDTNLNIIDNLRVGGRLIASANDTIVNIGSLQDFLDNGTLSSGEITMNAGFNYRISGIVDISPNRLRLPDLCTLFGVDRINTGITSDTTGALISWTDVNVTMRELFLNCPNGSIIDSLGTAAGTTNTCRMDGILTTECDTLGTVEAVRNLSLRSWSVAGSSGTPSTTTSGLAFVGACGEFNADNGFYSFWTDTLFDFKAATFTVINVGSGNRFEVDTGTLVTDGLVDSGNINTGGFGLIVDNVFFGDTAGSTGNIIQSDTRWDICGNGGIADSVKDASIYVADGDELLTALLFDTETLVAGTYTEAVARQFTTTTAGRITYISEKPVCKMVSFILQADPASGNNKVYEFFIRVDGTTLVPESRARVTADAMSPVTAVSQGIVDFSENTFIEIVVFNRTDAVDVTAQATSFIVS